MTRRVYTRTHNAVSARCGSAIKQLPLRTFGVPFATFFGPLARGQVSILARAAAASASKVFRIVRNTRARCELSRARLPGCRRTACDPSLFALARRIVAEFAREVATFSGVNELRLQCRRWTSSGLELPGIVANVLRLQLLWHSYLAKADFFVSG